MKSKRPEADSGSPVLMVAPQPFFTPTGTPINVLGMCRALCEDGYRVDILTFPLGADVEVDNLTHFRVFKLPFIRHIPVGFSIAKALYNLVLAMRLVTLLRRQRYLAVHALEESAFYAVPMARWFGVPAIVDLDSDLSQQLREHSSALGRLLAKPADWLRRHALRRAQYAITVAPYLSDLVRRESPATIVKEIRDVPLDAALREPDPAREESLRRELELPEGAPVIVYTGNFGRRQGLDLLIEAMPGICAEFPSCRLLLVGGEPDQITRLRRMAERLSVDRSVIFAGRRPPELMPEVMGLASALLSPRVEPNVTPLKIFSYMASGRPIIATDLPTHSTVLDGDCAILAPPSAQGMKEGVVKLLGEPELGDRLGAQARKKVHECYSFDIFKQRLLEVYALIGSAPSSKEA